MRSTSWMIAALLLLLGSASANATLMVNGTEPGCIDAGEYTFCNSSFDAQLNTTNGFDFTVIFDNDSYVQTLLPNSLLVDLFFQPPEPSLNSGPISLTINGFSLLGPGGSDLGIPMSFDSFVYPNDLQFVSGGPVPVNTMIHGFSVFMTCTDSFTIAVGGCDTGLTFDSVAITLDNDPNNPGASSLVVGRLPVPATLGLIGLGLAGLGWSRRKKA